MNSLEAIGAFVVATGLCTLISWFLGACLCTVFSDDEEHEYFWFWCWVVAVVIYGATLVVTCL